MIRVTQSPGGQYYAIEIESIENDMENIEIFVDEEGAVLIADNIDNAAEMLNVAPDDIELVY